MNVLSSILLVVALALDGLSLSFALGTARIKIGWMPGLIIAAIQTAVLAAAVLAGGFIESRVPPAYMSVLEYICAGVLMAIGIVALAKFISGGEAEHHRELTLKKSVGLGFTLSLDSLFSGVAGGSAVYYLLLPLSLCVNIVFILGGNRGALRLTKRRRIDLGWLSGIIFIALGFFKLI